MTQLSSAMPLLKKFLFMAAALSLAMVAAATHYPLLETDSTAGKIVVDFTTDAPSLSLENDLTATLTITSPGSLKVDIPSIDELRSRFEGFSIAEGFEREAQELAASQIKRTLRWRLRANPSAVRYRLAPFAISAGDDSFVSSAILFPLASLPDAEGAIEISPRKFFVWPTPKTLLKWLAIAAAFIALLCLIFAAIKRIHRAVRIMAMSPHQRALYELDALLARGLPEKGLFKDFYIELTFVVRRYIERTYDIRAPRLTTEEFLEKSKSDSRFGNEQIVKLSDFLHSADMVKFAGIEATIDMAFNAAASARRYIETDSAPHR